MGESIARRAHAILKQLVAIDEPMRQGEAERLCEGDLELLAKVRALLDALGRTGDFLESPIGRTVRDAARTTEQPGFPTIQGFGIERLIGVGGMAAVYEATQELPRRRVALKVLRRSMAGTAALRRFEFETEVLAKLRHPGIAQIYEAGTFDDGAGAIPFFAMEFVEGARTLTQYCEDAGLDIDARLRLMVRVCDAVQHGHQNGVIHRDLKPGNVLIDANGSPRVIDFGIARSIDEARGQHTTIGQIVGTLNAMSPEQCTPNANVDARTDVYSLGVMLYELLCHRPPHDLGSLPITEALRIIGGVAPKRPSSIDPRLRGDLEAIVLKAMEKDPDRRYRTAAALSADIRRYLEHQTIEARPPTILYQLRLLARRNRAAVAAALVVVLSLVAATAISLVAAFRATTELEQRVIAEGQARAERDTAVRKTYVASIAAAISCLQFGDYARMRSHLDAAPTALRGWEWRWLSAFVERSVASVEAARPGIMYLAASGDGRRLVTAALDGTVRVWSSSDLAEGAAAQLDIGPINDCAVFPRGDRMVAVSDDGAIVVMRAADGEVERTLREGSGSIRSVGARGTGTLALVTGAGELVLWDVDSDAPSRRLADESTAFVGARYSLDGKVLVTWASDGRVQARDPDTLAVAQEWDIGAEVGAIEVRPDLDRIAIGAANGRVAIKVLSSGEEALALAVPDQLSLVSSVAFSSRGGMLAVGQRSGAITMLELPTSALRGMAVGHVGAVSGLVFAADDERLLSSSWDGTLRAWDTGRSNASSGRLLEGHSEAVMAVAFAPSGSKDAPRLASASVDRTIRLWDLDEAEATAVLRGHTAAIYDATFSPDGSMLASAGFDNTVRLWDSARGDEIAVLEGHTDRVWSVSYSPDGSLLASAGDDRTVRLWDVGARRLLRTFEGHADRVTDVAFSHDGTRLATASRDRSVRIWPVDGGGEPRVLLGHDWDVFAVAWGLRDEELYSGSRDQTVRVWSPTTGETLAVLDGAQQFVTSLALSPDGSRLVAGTWYSSLCIFDPGRRELITSFKAVNGVIRGVAFSPDGRRLAVASGDGVVRLLDSSTATERSIGR